MNYISMFIIMKNDYFKLEFLWKTGCAFLLEENTWKLSEINTLNLEKRQVSFILLIRKRGVKVVNRDSLHGGSLEITRSPPLIYFSERVGAGGGALVLCMRTICIFLSNCRKPSWCIVFPSIFLLFYITTINQESKAKLFNKNNIHIIV